MRKAEIMSILEAFKCPNCGSNIAITTGMDPTIECHQCHQPLMNPFYDSKNAIQSFVIPTKLEPVLHRKTIIESLIGNRDVTPNSLNGFSIADINEFFLPVFVFECSYDAPWSARYGILDATNGFQNTRYREHGQGESGYLTGNTYALVPANSLSDFPHPVVVLIKQLCEEFDLGSAPNMESVYSCQSVSKEKFWSIDKNLNQSYNLEALAQIKKKVTGKARVQMQASSSILTVIDEKVSCKAKTLSQKLLYLPISVLHYQVGNDNYYSVLTCENSGTSIVYSHPIGGEEENLHYLMSQNKKKKQEVDHTVIFSILGAVLIGSIVQLIFKNIWCTIVAGVVCFFFLMGWITNFYEQKNKEIRIYNDSIQDETNKHLENLIEKKKQLLNGFQ